MVFIYQRVALFAFMLSAKWYTYQLCVHKNLRNPLVCAWCDAHVIYCSVCLWLSIQCDSMSIPHTQTYIGKIT